MTGRSALGFGWGLEVQRSSVGSYPPSCAYPAQEVAVVVLQRQERSQLDS